MICSLTARPFPDARARAGRLQLVSLGLLAFAFLGVWNPVTHPGPRFCLMRNAVGVPCPLCGMTRAVVAAVHGHLGRSLAFNPGGVIVLLLVTVLLTRPRLAFRIRPPLWTIAVALSALWAWNLGFNPTFH
jgi:hypothetical protein